MKRAEVMTLPKFVLITEFVALDETAATATVELDERFPLCYVTYHRGECGGIGELASVSFADDSFEQNRGRNRIVEARLRAVLPEFLHRLLLTELLMREEEECRIEEGFVHDDKPSDLGWECQI